MTTIKLHIYTLLIPAFLVIIALILLWWNRKRRKVKAIRTGFVLLFINGLITTFTSAMGGASLQMVKSSSGVDLSAATLHAWTAMAAFLLSVLIAVLAFGKLRSRSLRGLRLLIGLSILFLALFTLTCLIAITIRV